MQVTNLLDNIPIDLEEDVLRLLQDQNVNVGPIIEEQIHSKSNPEVGTGYSDLTPPGGRLELNSYRAKTRLGYSDSTGSQIYNFPKIRGVESMDEIVTFASLTERGAELIASMES